jgi:proline iminopeptidase
MRRFFDPSAYRIVLFDQRGCGRSQPHAEIANNTTWDLVADIERIRVALGIDRWLVFGGSWGATLALIYAQTHPERAAHLILRGVFLMTQRELDWFYGGGAGAFWPEQWAAFASLIPQSEQGDMIAAYHKRLFSDDRAEQVKFAQAWSKWENALASMGANGISGTPPAEYARAFARLENHYFVHGGFLEQDGQIMRDMPKIAHIPTSIVQGRYDMITPPRAAHDVAAAIKTSELVMVRDAAGM